MHYAVVIVPPTWESGHSLGFTKNQYETWHEKIEPGARMVLYQTSPINAIVAEAIVRDAFISLDELPQENRSPLFTGTGQPADYALPLEVNFVYPQRHYVSPQQLAQIVDTKQHPEGWIPVDDKTYRLLRAPLTQGVPA